MPPVTVGNCDLYHGDCLDILPTLDFTADLVIADPPYGITRCDWDTAPDLPRMWSCLLPRAKSDRSGLVLGTAGGEWMMVPGEGSALTPKDLSFQPQSNHGSEPGTEPLMTGASLVFLQRGGQVVAALRQQRAQAMAEAREQEMEEARAQTMSMDAKTAQAGASAAKTVNDMLAGE